MIENRKKILEVFFIAIIGSILFSVYRSLTTAIDIVGTTAVIKFFIKDYFTSLSSYVTLIIIAGIGMLLLKFPVILDKLYKYRYLAALIVFAVCVLLEISGSSMGEWCRHFNVKDSDILLGASRQIRTDEWAVGSPANMLQSIAGTSDMNYFTSAITGYSIDGFVGYGIPVKSWVILFKPFLSGYLFLSAGRGLSFYWCGRLIVLILASFEFGMLITGKRKGMSIIYMMLVAFSPAVSWWFSTSIVEMLITLQFSVVLFNKYMITNNTLKRIPMVLGIIYCAGIFLLTLYPAWMIPFAFVIAGLVIYIIVDKHKECKMKPLDFVCIAVGIILLGVSVKYIFNKSQSTISAMTQTVFPGARFETGGKGLTKLTSYISNTWSAVFSSIGSQNSCEAAAFYGLFPVCYIISIAAMIKNKKKDLLTIILLIISAFFTIWCVLGFPHFLARITFMSNCPVSRILVVLSFCNVILLFRGMSQLKSAFNVRTSIITASICGFISCILYFAAEYNSIHTLIGKLIYVLMLCAFILYTGIFYLVLRQGKIRCRKLLYAALAVLSIVSGLMVNPVRKGMDSVLENDSLQCIKEIEKRDNDALWAVDNKKFPYNNICELAGVASINSTNVCPELDKWGKIDTDKKYEDIYNRYAHVRIEITDTDEAAFCLDGQPDMFLVKLSVGDLQKLGVKYILTDRDLSYMDTGEYRLELLQNSQNYYVYQIKILN